MRVICILSVFLTLLIISCQKEIDWGLNTNTPDQLLVKIQSKSGSDSVIVTYNYNTAKQLIQEKTIGISGGTSVDADLNIYRTAAGIIDRTVQVVPALVALGIDSIVTKYYYNSANAHYTAAVFTLDVMGVTVTDSTVFTYDANNRISTDEHYQKMTGLPLAVLSLKNQYSYSANGLDLLSVQSSAATTFGGPLSPLATQSFTYDSKKSPLILKNEGIVLLRTGLYSAHNPIKSAMVNTADPTANTTVDLTYRYNTANKPDSSFSTTTPGGALTASKYFYQ